MKTNHKIKRSDWEILARYFCNEVNDSERREVETRVARSDDFMAAMDEGRKAIENAGIWVSMQRYDPVSAWTRVAAKAGLTDLTFSRTGEPVGNMMIKKLLRVAAALILAITLGALGYYFANTPKHQALVTEIVSDSRHVVSGIALPDGSVVAVNSNSRLTYPREFSDNVREVNLEGEAYFEILPDPARPFVIVAGNARVSVLGTAFNLSAYPEHDNIEVVVESGKVRFSKSGSGNESPEEIVLGAGDKGVFLNASRTLHKMQNTDRNVAAWKTRRLVFNETPLSEVVAVIGRIYYAEIEVPEPATANLLLTATFNDQPMDFIMDVICLTFQLNLKSDGEKYILTSRNL